LLLYCFLYRSQKLEFSADVLSDMKELQAAGALPKWGKEAAANSLSRRNVFMGELKQMGIKSPDKIAVPSIRNDAAFLITTVGEEQGAELPQTLHPKPVIRYL
jgi:hypothetical protein